MENELLCIIASGDVEKLADILELDTQQEQEQLQLSKDAIIYNGKTALEVATCFGQLNLIEEMVKNGFQTDYISPKGYSLLHWAACWGQLEVIKYYVELNINIFLENSHGETARKLAVRYQKDECASFLQKAELIQELKQLALYYKDIIADPEKNMGRFNKEDKVHGNRNCDEKLDWIETNRDIASFQQICGKKIELENQLSVAMSKLD